MQVYLAARGGSRTEPFGVASGRMQGAAKRRILEVFQRAATPQPVPKTPERRRGDFHHGLLAITRNPGAICKHYVAVEALDSLDLPRLLLVHGGAGLLDLVAGLLHLIGRLLRAFGVLLVGLGRLLHLLALGLFRGSGAIHSRSL